MVKQLLHWRWSSYRSMIAKTAAPDWLETDWILGHFGEQRKRAVQKYVDFVKAGKGVDSVWENKKHPVILGDETFIESVYKHYVDDSTLEVKEINRLERRSSGKGLESYFGKGVEKSSWDSAGLQNR